MGRVGMGVVHLLPLLYLLLELEGVSAAVTSPQGNNACPCINKTAEFIASGKAANSSCLLTTQGGCVPIAYGSDGCQNYDELFLAECKEPNPPAGCQSRFCFVDPTTCKLQNRASDSFGNDAHYSAATCGGVDHAFFANQLKGSTLRVKYLDKFSKPFAYRKDDGSIAGFGPALLQEISERAGFSIVETELSEAGLAEGNQWSGCVHDVSLGNVDVCCCNVWDTTSRRLKVDFSPALLDNYFRLMVLKAKDPPTFVDDLGQMFRPFSPTLWISIVAGCILTALAYQYLEHGDDHEDMPHPRGRAGTSKNFLLSFFHTFMHFFQAGPTSMPKTPAGRVISFGFSFFVLVVVASYTANLAAYLTANQGTNPIASIDDLITKGKSLCVAKDAADIVAAQYPSVKLRPLDRTEIGEELLGAGECGAFYDEAASASYMLRVGDQNGVSHCDKQMVGESLATINVALALPHGSLLGSSVSYYVRLLSDQGVASKLRGEHFDVPSECPAENAQAGADQNQLTVVQMGGGFVCLGIALVIGLVFHLVSHLMARRKVAPGPSTPRKKGSAGHLQSHEYEPGSGGSDDAEDSVAKRLESLEAMQREILSLLQSKHGLPTPRGAGQGQLVADEKLIPPRPPNH